MHFVQFLILHLKFMLKLCLILCLLQPIEASQRDFDLRHNSEAHCFPTHFINFVNTVYPEIVSYVLFHWR